MSKSLSKLKSSGIKVIFTVCMGLLFLGALLGNMAVENSEAQSLKAPGEVRLADVYSEQPAKPARAFEERSFADLAYEQENWDAIP